MGFDDGRGPPRRVPPPLPGAKQPEPDEPESVDAREVFGFSSRPPRPATEPTILLVGADRSFHTAIASALAQHGVYVETSPISGVVDTVVATAPDLVVLVGDAAQGGGSEVLASLNASPHSSVVPVALLADDAALGERLRAFRHGAAAVIPRSASVDAIAERIAGLAREIPERDREGLGNVGEATLGELVDALSKELRSGILSVRASESTDEAIRVVLGGGRPLAQTIDEFVARLRRHVVHAEPLMYEFDERAGGTVQLLGGDMDPAGALEDVSGLRVLLADENAARADAVAQALREHDTQVVVTDYEPSEQRFARLRQFDPAILLVDEPSLRGPAFHLVRRMRKDTRLRWSSLLVLDWEAIWSAEEESPTVERMLGTLAALAEPEHSLVGRVDTMPAFDTRLEITGPARLLRAFSHHPRALRFYVYNPRINIRVDLSETLVAGARAQVASGGQVLDGTLALSALLQLGSGRVHVERIDEPELVNIMATVDVALDQAEHEQPPIAASMPAPDGDGFSMPPPPTRRRFSPLLWIPVALAGVAAVAGGVIYAVDPSVIPSMVAGAGEGAPAASPETLAELAGPSTGATPLKTASANSTASPSAEPATSARAAEPGASAPSASAAAPAASAAAPEAAPPPPTSIEGSEMEPGEMAVKLESHKSVPTCEEIVGASWKLLSGDQPARARQEVGAGRRALIVGKLDDAQVAFCRATALDTANPDSFKALVRVFLLLRDPKKARDWAERAIKHHPDDRTLRGLFGDALARTGDTERAVSIWLEDAGIGEKDVAGIHSLAATYAVAAERALAGADYAQADRLFRRAALIDESNARAAGGLAKSLLLQGELRAAAPWSLRALALDPRNADIRLTMGDIYEKLGMMDKAHAEWLAALELDPRNMRAHARARRIPPGAR